MGTYPRGGKNTQGSVSHASLVEIVAASKITAHGERVCIENQEYWVFDEKLDAIGPGTQQPRCGMAK
jgi:hypothetical protein